MSTVTKALANREGQDAIALAIQNIGAANIGNLSALTTITKTSLVAAINELNSKKADAESISPVEESDTASSAHSSGTYFYLDGKILKATEDIDEGDTIDSSNSQEIVLTEELESKSTVEASTTNGNIIIDNVETPVYRLKGNNTVLSTDRTPYLLREALSVTNASAYVREKLIGCSVAWNQLVNGNFENYTKTSGSTITKSGDTYTFTKSGTQSVMYGKEANVVVPIGHKILIIFKGLTTSVYASLVRSNSNTTDLLINPDTPYLIHQVANNDVYGFGLYLNANLASSVSWKTYQCIDLTLAFGSTVADTLYAMTNNGGIDWLRNHNYPIDQYTAYGYNLVSSKTSGKKIVGSNIWNGILIQGHLDGNGNYVSDTGNGVAPDFIKVKSGETYTLKTTSFTAFGAYYMNGYDGNKTHISQFVSTSHTSGTSLTVNVTIPDDVQYIKIQFNNTGTFAGNLYTKCILKKSTVTVDEEYWETTYSLGNDELRGHLIVQNGEIVAEGDMRESNGNVQRNWHEAYNLGNLTWAYESTYQFFYHIANSSSPIYGMKINSAYVCDKYAYMGYKADADMSSASKGIYSHGTYIYIKDTAYTDATTFKTSLDGTYAQYELATPTTETSSPFADPMSLNGCTTEEYVDTRSIPVPVGHETQYMGQSDDVVEIPSMPLADGDSVLHCQKSGNEAQIYWEGKTKYNVLYQGSLTSGNSVTLEDTLANYNYIGIATGDATNSSSQRGFIFAPVNATPANRYFADFVNSYIRLYANGTTFTFLSAINSSGTAITRYIYEIYGYK